MPSAIIDDLKRSGLNDSDRRKLHMKALSKAQVHGLTGNKLVGYLIPYYDIDGKEIKEYWRVRYLEEQQGKFGAKLKKPPRYTGPKNVLPRFYLPTNIKWRKIADDAAEPVLFTEGEKKAAKACKSGLPCISVPGVWAWRSKKKGVAAIPDFDDFNWTGRKVYLCFDNDLMTNPLVIGALSGLGAELFRRGAVVIIKMLPTSDDKIGLDDYLLKHSKTQWAKLEQEEFGQSSAIWELNGELAYLRQMNSICHVAKRTFYSNKQQLCTIAYAHKNFTVPKANGEGFVTKNAAEEWLKWPNRRTYEDITYKPGEDEVVDNCVNLWTGFAAEPMSGSIKPFVEFMNYLFAGEEETKEWVWKWLAYPIQNPGTKLYSAVLLHSPHQGVGKSFLGYIMGDIYGSNFSVVSEEQVHGAFNDWCAHKQFVMGEEMTGSEKRRDADRIKNMLTRERLTVNRKYQPVYEIPDCANYLFTSNHPDAFILEETDRRVLVHGILTPPRAQSFYEALSKWRKNDGPAYLMHHLLNEVDCSDFNPTAPAPITTAKRSMQGLSKSDLDLFCVELNENPDNVLSVGRLTAKGELMTVRELHQFLPDTGLHHSLNGLGRALRRNGFPPPRACMTKHGTQRLIAVRNRDKWEKKKGSQLADHWDKFHPLEKYK